MDDLFEDNLLERVTKSNDENEIAYIECEKMLKEGSERRFYLATRIEEGSERLIGIFSNRKPMMGALYKIGLQDSYIIGKKTDKKVTAATIGTSLQNSICKIYRNGEIIFKIREITLNRLNPEFFNA